MNAIRILSDLHIDINNGYPLSWNNKEIFTIIAGDTSGDPKQAVNWINRHFKKGIVISGNHIVYNDKNLTIQELREIYAKAFPIKSKISYLDCLTNDGFFTKEVDGILFVGSTLYTNFRLSIDGQANIEDNLYWASKLSNDYYWGFIKDSRLNSIRKLRPTDILEFFKITIQRFKEAIEIAEKENPEKPIVVITHYTPSIKCIASHYVDDEIISSYASNLEQFILDHKNIKLWICGHSHNQTTFKVGECRIVMNPRGYCMDHQDVNFDKDLLVDTKTWEVIRSDWKSDSWRLTHNARH